MIGNTPLIRLNQIGSHIPNVEFYLKAEFCNPTGSVKDRTALSMLLSSERRGELKPKGQVVQPGYNTTAISLAWICTIRQYKFRCLVSGDTDPQKIKDLQTFGAQVEVVPEAKGNWDETFLRKAKEIKEKKKRSDSKRIQRYGEHECTLSFYWTRNLERSRRKCGCVCSRRRLWRNSFRCG
ncbi:pyridoxal-phosphate dependent domain protein [Leptospira borgpetersenii serovar Pomona str. 200901868]|uniref:Pyridoxal-phosphate dependent domain protein n=1 Tax=Leptospira borgpetersenii serovar Pomona str. 200901868 TaxID=1192866 RepID=M6WRR4_LEPBO|nr:pyridoxal-phosphate dependent domain protein [Leptospira borgpetersenii serovar Pomona str. 200901868]